MKLFTIGLLTLMLNSSILLAAPLYQDYPPEAMCEGIKFSKANKNCLQITGEAYHWCESYQGALKNKCKDGAFYWDCVGFHAALKGDCESVSGSPYWLCVGAKKGLSRNCKNTSNTEFYVCLGVKAAEQGNCNDPYK